MLAREPVARMSYAEYAAAEIRAESKREYIRGAVYAMAGGTPEHAALAAALAREVGVALAARPCRVYSSDARIRIEATDMSTYPDLSVVCGALVSSPGDPLAISNPIVIFEVLSDSTEAYDRGAKASHYRHIPSLREYVLVSQSERRVEVQRRNSSGHWEIHEYGPTGDAVLEALGVSVSLDTLYRDPLAS